MRGAVAILAGVLALGAVLATLPSRAVALEPDRYTVYCADERIEVSIWDLEQMKVRRGSDVCAFTSYTSYSDALSFAQKNFGGEGKSCRC